MSVAVAVSTSLATATTGLIAGLVASPHCLLMCAPLDRVMLRGASPAASLRLHTGRVLGYTALGSIAGAAGLTALHLLPDVSIGLFLQGLAAAALIAVGLRALGRRRASACGGCAHAAPRRHLLLPGVARAFVPCAAIYAMLLLAAGSQSPLQGALALFAFGLGTTPSVAGGGLLLTQLKPHGNGIRIWPGGALTLAGLASLAMVVLQGIGAAPLWCLAPVH